MNSIIDGVTRACVFLGDLLFWLLAPLGAAWALVIISAVTGLAMLYIWRYTSNQKALADARRQIAAHLLATRLYRDNLAVTFRAQGQIIWQALRLLRYAVRPILVMVVPFTLFLAQLGFRYEHRPAAVGQVVRVKATLRDASQVMDIGSQLRLPAGLRANATDPCRVPPLRTVDWRVTPERDGDYTLAFGSGADMVEMPLRVGGGLVRISPLRGGDWLARMLYSAEPSLPETSAFEALEIYYPLRVTPLLGFHIHWLISLLVLSMAFAFALRPWVKVHF